MNELFMNLVASPSIIVKFKISLFSLFIVIYISIKCQFYDLCNLLYIVIYRDINFHHKTM